MREWYERALAERWRDVPHDARVQEAGTIVEDLRAT